MSVTRSRAALLLFLYNAWPGATPALTQQGDTLPPDSASISGRLTARSTHEPIPGAVVVLGGTRLVTTTDSAGRFTLTGLSPGVHQLVIRAVGYAAGSWQVTLQPGQVLSQLWEMDPLPVELPGVVVKGRLPLAARRFADFERRRHAGIGAYLTQEQIERANPSSLVDVLVTVRGVQQVCITNNCIAKMVRSPPGCYPQYYLDGVESTPYFARLTPPEDVKGIEIYRGSSETPGEFQGSNSGCGVIAIWTKSSP
jgi:carboxypeptidase family protein/TonB-dependent receptor-like protein